MLRAATLITARNRSRDVIVEFRCSAADLVVADALLGANRMCWRRCQAQSDMFCVSRVPGGPTAC
jgi:hypothetical protein